MLALLLILALHCLDAPRSALGEVRAGGTPWNATSPVTVGMSVGGEAADMPRLRVGSYNVLAQCLAKSSYFPTSRGTALKWKHRFPRLCKTLEGLRSSILVLSEVDEIDSYAAFLREQGYEFTFKPKPGKRWGSLMAWKAAEFELVQATSSCDMNDLPVAMHHGLISSAELGDGVGVDPAHYARDGVGIYSVLRPREGNPLAAAFDALVVGGTHLYWNPAHAAVKVAQAAQFTLCLGDVVARALSLTSPPGQATRVGVIIAGDMNSTPGDPAYAVLHQVRVPPAGAATGLAVAVSAGGGAVSSVSGRASGSAGSGAAASAGGAWEWDRMASDVPAGMTAPAPPAHMSMAGVPPPSVAGAGSTPTGAPEHPRWLPVGALTPAYEAWLRRLVAEVRRIAPLYLPGAAAALAAAGGYASAEADPPHCLEIQMRSSYGAMGRARAPPGAELFAGLSDAAFEPAFTTKTHDWQGCIDYIYYSHAALPLSTVVDGGGDAGWTEGGCGACAGGAHEARYYPWSVADVLPMPTLEEVSRLGDVGMPSEIFPSDHCPLMAEMAVHLADE